MSDPDNRRRSVEPTLAQLLEDRRSCRAFTSTPVPEEVLERMLALAQNAPSWCNTQPWAVDLLSGLALERLRTQLRRHIHDGGISDPDFMMPSAYSGVYRTRRRESGWQLYNAVGVVRGDRASSSLQASRNFDFFDAPHVMIVSTAREQGTYGAVDGGIYLGMLLLAAHSLGVAAVAQAALAHHSAFLRSFLDLGDDRSILLAVSLGYADDQHPANSFRTTRAPLSEVVRYHSE